MNPVELIREISAYYQKFDWRLKRILLSPETREKFDISPEKPATDAEIIESEIDALWFSRPSGKDRAAWELRHLSPTPYALFEILENDTPEEELEDTLHELELRLIEYVCKNTDF